MKVEIKKLNKNAKIPTKGSKYAAGYDLYACLEKEKIEIKPHTTVKINTGLSFKLPTGYFGAIFARSGIATKQNLRPANCVGVCDEDYTGEYIVPIFNDSNETKIINNNDRIAQLILLPYLNMEFKEVNEIKETERGNNGFGSSGMK